jgi:S-adenosylmethionine:tRNA ribosyltransferase-isomerase
LYWLGVKKSEAGSRRSDEITQWEVYENNEQKISPQAALINLKKWMDKKGVDSLTAKTQIMIAPGYNFKIVNGLVTNFHQPQSTLLLLVAGLIGNDWRKVYDYALENNFRFLSYGDGSLLWTDQA